jgi:hypothetical protein
MTRKTKTTLQPHLLISEIKHRLLKAGCRDYHLGELSKAPSWSSGRNWTVQLHAEGPDRDTAIRILRMVGNDFDCQFERKRSYSRRPARSVMSNFQA